MVVLTCSRRQSDPRQSHYALEAREFLRKKLIGKHVKVHVDFIRPREGEFVERECATVRYGNQNTYVDPVSPHPYYTDEFLPQKRR